MKKSRKEKNKKGNDILIKEPKGQKKSLNKADLFDSIDYPIFCFKHLQSVSISDCTDGTFFYKFLERLNKLSNLGWNEIRLSERHSFGMEKIPVEKIHPSLPPFITPDVEDLSVFRAAGDNRPFLGIQNDKIFHVIFIETKFGDIYDHYS